MKRYLMTSLLIILLASAMIAPVLLSNHARDEGVLGPLLVGVGINEQGKLGNTTSEGTYFGFSAPLNSGLWLLDVDYGIPQYTKDIPVTWGKLRSYGELPDSQLLDDKGSVVHVGKMMPELKAVDGFELFFTTIDEKGYGGMFIRKTSSIIGIIPRMFPDSISDLIAPTADDRLIPIAEPFAEMIPPIIVIMPDSIFEEIMDMFMPMFMLEG